MNSVTCTLAALRSWEDDTENDDVVISGHHFLPNVVLTRTSKPTRSFKRKIIHLTEHTQFTHSFRLARHRSHIKDLNGVLVCDKRLAVRNKKHLPVLRQIEQEIADAIRDMQNDQILFRQNRKDSRRDAVIAGQRAARQAHIAARRAQMAARSRRL